MRYEIGFTPDSKIITFPISMGALGVCAFGCLIGLGQIYIGYQNDATFLVVAGAFISILLLVVMLAVVTQKKKILLTQEQITLEQTEQLFKRSAVTVAVDEVNAVFKERHIIKGKYGTRSDAYGLVVNYGANEELMLIRSSMDVKKVDELKSIIKNYTGVPTRLTREG